MAEDKITMPSGMGGLTGFGWESGSKLKIPPHIIIIAIIVIAIAVILMHAFGGAWLASK